MQGEDEAVSPVIATVLLLAITVMLSSMVFVLMSSSLSTVEKQPPNAKVSVRALSNGFHVVKITQLDQQLDLKNRMVTSVSYSKSILERSN